VNAICHSTGEGDGGVNLSRYTKCNSLLIALTVLYEYQTDEKSEDNGDGGSGDDVENFEENMELVISSLIEKVATHSSAPPVNFTLLTMMNIGSGCELADRKWVLFAALCAYSKACESPHFSWYTSDSSR